MVTGNPFNTSYSIFLYKMLANDYNFFLRQMLVEQRSTFGFHEEFLTMVAKISLMRSFGIFSSFDYILSFLSEIILTIRVLADYIYFSTWASHMHHMCRYALLPNKVCYCRTLPKIPIHSDDLSCYTLDPVSHLTFLAFHHVFQHQSLRLDWVYDIACLMNSLSVPEDWEALRSSCVANHIRIPLEIALIVGPLWAGGIIPEKYADFAGWESASFREQKLWKYAKARRSSLHSGFCLTLQGMPSTQEKMRYCRRFILPPRELMKRYSTSESALDIPLAHIRRWCKAVNYKF